MQGQANSPRNEGLQSIPWGSTNQQAPAVNQSNYHVSEKLATPEASGKRICGVRKNRFILFVLLGLFAIAITIIAAVVAAERRKSPRVVRQGADVSSDSASTTTSPTATSSRPAATSVAPVAVLLSLTCTGNTSASIFQPSNGGATKAFGFTASCGLDCAASNIFTFEKYNVELCATTCAGKTNGQCGAMVFSYNGINVKSSTKEDRCLLTTSCMPR